MARRIAVIGGSPRIFPRAPRPEFELVLMHSRSVYGYDEQMESMCDGFVDVDFVRDYDRLERLFLEMHAESPFERAYAQDEDALVVGARLNQLIGAVDNDVLAAWRLKDKSLMRQCLSGRTGNAVRFALVASAEELRQFGASIEGKVIVKPLEGSGSLDVYTLERAADARLCWSDIQSKGYKVMLAEEFIDGPEFSVETYSWNGHHVVIGVNRKKMRGSMEIGHAIPCDLPESIKDELCRATLELLDVVGLTHGPAHTELRIDGGGARPIESHNRTAGSKIPEMIELAYGFDVLNLTFGVPLGLSRPLTTSPVPHGVAAMRHILPDPGTVVEITGVGDIRDPDVRVVIGLQPGDFVEEERNSYDLIKVGSWVVAQGTCEEEAVTKCEDALDHIKIVTR